MFVAAWRDDDRGIDAGAVYVYEKNLGAATRLGASNRYVDATQRRLGELRALLAETTPDKIGSIAAIRRFLAMKPTDRLAR